VADVRGDGTATVWSSTQDVYMQREAVARLIGSANENVRVIYVEGSGCYGHNGSDDANGDAALLSKELGAPVRVQWMRHDEFGWAPRGAPYLVEMKAGLNEAGDITAWDRQAWVLTHSARYSRYGERTSGYLLATQLSGGKVDVPLVSEPGKIINNASIGGVRTVLYQVPALRTLVHGLQTAEPHPLRPTELRSVSGLGGLFACESFLDELAASAGRDPLQYRLARLDNRRAIDVLEAVARLAGWESRASPAPRRTDGGLMTGRGVALYGENTFVAVVAEVAVNGATGEVRVSRVHVAHDCGLIINPDGLKNQIEGNVVQSTSRCMLEQVTWDGAGVTSLDWQSYPILRFPDVPDVRITLINRPDVPATGGGEGTTYPMAAAIGNAVFDATGARLREGPFTPERMKAALAALRA
jgi:CO/xanthine dehydrogenase Mo-binding subunit